MDWNRIRALQAERAGAKAVDAKAAGANAAGARPSGRPRDSKARQDAEAICKEKLDRALDEGLEDTFPGSDPVAVVQPPSSPYDRRKRTGTLR